MLIFYLFINSLIPAVVLLIGLWWKKHPPQKINWAYGYRTRMSMKNPATWEFAHQYYGRILRASGAILLPFSIVPLLSFKDKVETVTVYVSILQLAVLVLSLIPTEIALRRKFDGSGNPRDPKEGG